MIAEYIQTSAYTGLSYRCRQSGVSSVTDEPYPPGGMLRVMRNAAGQIVGGPLISEVSDWRLVPEAAGQ